MSKSIAFFGASTGCGLSTLHSSLNAGHKCQVLLRTPTKLQSHFPSPPSNLTVVPGNAHDLATVKETITLSSSTFVDVIVFSIGGVFNFASFSLDDPHVCETGIKVLLQAIADLRSSGFTGTPRIVALSSTGVSTTGRDVPLWTKPLLGLLLKAPHADKRAMETTIVASSESWTVVRPSILTDGKTDKTIRVGVESPTAGWEHMEVGYSVSREDVGKWIFTEIIEAGKYEGKLVSITW